MLHITDGRGVLGISWKDRITNVEVRTRTGQQTMDNILRERRLRWLGHVFRMDHKRIPQQALYWQVSGYKRGPVTRSTKSKLEECSQQRPTKDGVHLGGSRGGSSRQTRMASERGPMCPVGYGLNQGQGQGQLQVAYELSIDTKINDLELL